MLESIVMGFLVVLLAVMFVVIIMDSDTDELKYKFLNLITYLLLVNQVVDTMYQDKWYIILGALCLVLIFKCVYKHLERERNV